jgi:hypothetical protein
VLFPDSELSVPEEKMFDDNGSKSPQEILLFGALVDDLIHGDFTFHSTNEMWNDELPRSVRNSYPTNNASCSNNEKSLSIVSRKATSMRSERRILNHPSKGTPSLHPQRRGGSQRSERVTSRMATKTTEDSSWRQKYSSRVHRISEMSSFIDDPRFSDGEGSIYSGSESSGTESVHSSGTYSEDDTVTSVSIADLLCDCRNDYSNTSNYTPGATSSRKDKGRNSESTQITTNTACNLTQTRKDKSKVDINRHDYHSQTIESFSENIDTANSYSLTNSPSMKQHVESVRSWRPWKRSSTRDGKGSDVSVSSDKISISSHKITAMMKGTKIGSIPLVVNKRENRNKGLARRLQSLRKLTSS